MEKKEVIAIGAALAAVLLVASYGAVFAMSGQRAASSTAYGSMMGGQSYSGSMMGNGQQYGGMMGGYGGMMQQGDMQAWCYSHMRQYLNSTAP